MMIRYLAVLLIIVFIGGYEVNSNEFKNDPPQKIDASTYKISPYDIVYGSENAPIEVLEYYSLTCPHCAYFFESLFPKIKKDYIDSGKVKWVKRIYIMDLPGNDGALLLACIDKSKRDNYLRVLLNKQSSWALTDNYFKTLENIAKLGGMKTEKFSSCMNDKETDNKLKELTLNARKLGINGTPMFYINKERLIVDSERSFSEKFDAILNSKN